MINSKDINQLNPMVAKMCEQFIAKCKEQGIDVIITSTYRDGESQDALYAQGRTTPGKKVTNARSGQSYHNWRVAFDFCPLVNKEPAWNDTALFKKCGEIGESIGFEWGGRWKGNLEDLAHLQYTHGLTLHDFQEGKNF